MTTRILQTGMTLVALLLAAGIIAQERFKGTAIVSVGDDEFTIPIECNDSSRPELGFSTEPSRITRETTGRSSGVRLTVRPWKDTDELVVSLDRYVAWIPLSDFAIVAQGVEINLSPASVLRNNMPVAMTYDLWTSGDRPPGLQDVHIQADCTSRNPAAPAYRKLHKTENN